MSDGSSIPSFWSPDAVKLDILTPLALLRIQASKLSEETRGLLIGEVTTMTTEPDQKSEVIHRLDVIAPALDNYRQRFIVVYHKPNAVYPSRMETMVGEFVVPTEGDFFKELRTYLRSPYVVAAMQSLIARSNEAIATSSENNAVPDSDLTVTKFPEEPSNSPT